MTTWTSSATLDALNEYVLLAPETSDAVLYRRNGAFWTRYALTDGDDPELESIGFRQDLAGFLGHR